ncbi:hypothetical protein [Streptomyces sp. NPDC003015]
MVGGALTEADWRWTFMLSVPVAVATLIGALLLVPKDPAHDGTERHYDAAGAVTVTAAMLLLVYGIVQAPTKGSLSGAILGVLALAALLLAAFTVTESRAPQPLLRLGLLRNKSLVGADLIAGLVAGTAGGIAMTLGEKYRAGRHRPTRRTRPGAGRAAADRAE